MPGFWDRINPIGKHSYVMPIANKSFRKGAENLLMGTPEKHERKSTLLPEQEALLDQLTNAGQNRGAGGAFGESADYYRDLLSNDPELLQQFNAPEMRRFNEQTIPGLAEQFAGMGSGNLSSSGFRNAAVGAGTDLQERLGAIRANLRQNAAQGLTNIGQMGLGNYSQDVMTEQGSQGLLSSLGPAAVSAGLGFLTGGPGGAVVGGLSGLSGGMMKKGSTSPYGGQQQQQQSPYGNQSQRFNSGNGFGLPQFGQR
jgi:hypothetical protein